MLSDDTFTLCILLFFAVIVNVALVNYHQDRRHKVLEREIAKQEEIVERFKTSIARTQGSLEERVARLENTVGVRSERQENAIRGLESVVLAGHGRFERSNLAGRIDHLDGAFRQSQVGERLARLEGTVGHFQTETRESLRIVKERVTRAPPQELWQVNSTSTITRRGQQNY